MNRRRFDGVVAANGGIDTNAYIHGSDIDFSVASNFTENLYDKYMSLWTTANISLGSPPSKEKVAFGVVRGHRLQGLTLNALKSWQPPQT